MKLIVSGTTGVGKSTTVNLLKKYYEKKEKKVIILGELVVDNPYFNLYFDELYNWGYIAQLDFLMQRFKQWLLLEKKFSNINNDDYIIIYDRHFLEDIIFAELKFVRDNTSYLLTQSYKIIFDELINKIHEFEKPEFFILLKASYDTVFERQFEKRGRTQEEKFNNKYWQDLYYRYYASKKYRNIFKENTKNFVEIDTDDSTPEEVLEKISKYIERRTQ